MGGEAEDQDQVDRPIAHDLIGDRDIAGLGCRAQLQETLGLDNDVCKPITVGIGKSDLGHPAILTRWRLSDEDRARVAKGEDLYIVVMADRLSPMQVEIGPAEELIF